MNNLIPNNVENNDNFDNGNNPVHGNNFDNMNNFENNENNVGNENNIENVLEPSQVNVNEPRYALRDRRNLQPPNRGDFISDFENIDELFIADFDEPKDYEQAVNSANSDDWRKAMKDEILALNKNKTWILSNRWVFKIKNESDVNNKKFRARLVIKR